MIMDSINKVRDEKVRTLAKTLRQSGLAASDSEAIRMAEGMTSTESRIQKTTESKKAPVKKREPQKVQEPVMKEFEKEESDDIPGSVEKYDQNLISEKDEVDFTKITTEQAASYQEPEEKKYFEEPEEKEESQYPEYSEEKEDSEEKEEPKPEFKTLERKPKKDMSQFEEAQVDLGSVFNSSKK